MRQNGQTVKLENFEKLMSGVTVSSTMATDGVRQGN